MPRRNRVDPFGDLHAVPERGLFTGNRGCVVDDAEQVVRHHAGQLWITCLTQFRGWRVPLARPRRWTPLFLLDDAVALAAGHRPCGTCRRADFRSYREAVAGGRSLRHAPTAAVLDDLLRRERLRSGRGLHRGADRITWTAAWSSLPDGTVVVDAGAPRVVCGAVTAAFGFGGWADPRPRPTAGDATVLTPPTSVAALSHGFAPVLHPSLVELDVR